MNRRLLTALSAMGLAAVLLQSAPAFADPPAHSQGWKHHWNDARPYGYAEDHDGDRPRYYARDYDDHVRYERHGYGDEHHGDWDDHPGYYPRRGYVIERLPPRCHVVHYRGAPYYYDGGAWYQPYGPRFIVVAPPVGLTVSFLPNVYTTLWFGSVPYYYANSAYYVWRPERRAYVVTEAPYRR